MVTWLKNNSDAVIRAIRFRYTNIRYIGKQTPGLAKLICKRKRRQTVELLPKLSAEARDSCGTKKCVRM